MLYLLENLEVNIKTKKQIHHQINKKYNQTEIPFSNRITKNNNNNSFLSAIKAKLQIFKNQIES